MREVAFDGIPGPTHNFAGLSLGNVASAAHSGDASNPRAAALQALGKMRLVASLGSPRGVLPPHPRPDVGALRRLGFAGSDADVIEGAARADPHLLPIVSSASSMWTANAATVVPACDATDGRTHLVVANLSAMAHRCLEAPVTARVLEAIFADPTRFAVHRALPLSLAFGDEGAANHTRLSTAEGVVHLFAWGRRAFGEDRPTKRYPARQTMEASAAVARIASIDPAKTLLWRQAPEGVDGGAFHTDVLAVGTGAFLMLHEAAFDRTSELLAELERRLGRSLHTCLATELELPIEDAVSAYPFNSELVEVSPGVLAIVAPTESRDRPNARAFLERVVATNDVVTAVHYIDVNESMGNGGGPACLRLRVPLEEGDHAAIRARVSLDESLAGDLETWIRRHYRDRLVEADLADPALLVESRTALDELTRILQLGSVYDFQA